MINIPEKHKNSNKVYVDTINIASQAGHPRVYYKIDPKVGFVVCGYSNTCFILSNTDTYSDNLFIYDGS